MGRYRGSSGGILTGAMKDKHNTLEYKLVDFEDPTFRQDALLNAIINT